MKKAPIGIFDSGLGGLTVASEIARALPNESIVYVGDTKRCPYGPQNPEDVARYVLEIGQFLENQGVKLIVIACNTATAVGLTLAQQHFSVPVLGVVEPGARAAVQATRNRLVGVIGTQGTIQSGTYSDAVRALDAGCTVYSVATPLFVEIVEEGLMFDDSEPTSGHGYHDVFIRPQFYEIARDYLDPLKRSGVDTLVLGCTHYPLLTTAIGQVMGPHVTLVSSAEETSAEVSATLHRRGHEADPHQRPTHRFFTTGDVSSFMNLGSRVFGAPLSDVAHIDIEDLNVSLIIVKGSFMNTITRTQPEAGLRPLTATRGVITHALGSCEIMFGNTRVLCVASIDDSVPPWRKGKGLGWVTAEYSMLPGATHTRGRRERQGAKGRTLEIERLIGRSLRSVVDMKLLGEVTVTIDCDVIQADGGTRTASITGAYIALVDALEQWKLAGKLSHNPLTGQVAAVSVGIVDGECIADLDYSQDSRAEVDMNVVMDGQGRYIEVQGTGEQITFGRDKLDMLLDAATAGIDELLSFQREVLEQD